MSNCKNIRGRLGLLLVLPVLYAAPSAAQDAVPAAQALLEQFDELYRSTGTAARIEIKIERPKKGADDADALLEPRRGQGASRH